MTRLCPLVVIAACLSMQPVVSLSTQRVDAAEPFESAAAFLGKHCLVCHNADDPNGNLDFGALKYNSDNRDNFARWVKIHDRVKAGEMPPADEPRPDAKALASFV